MYRLELDFTWIPVNEELNKMYSYPNSLNPYMRKQYKMPAIYRWKVHQPTEECEIVYIGETNNMINRLNGYLKPGPSQMTNIRMSSQFVEFISKQHLITLELMDINSLSFNNKEFTSADLVNPSLRKLIENLVIIDHQEKGFLLLNA